MNPSLYQAAAGMKATARWQEVISENLSSSFIPGFKKQTLSFSAVQAGLMAPASTSITGPSRHFSLPSANTGTDFQPGELKPTGNPTDLALENSGFFELLMPNGAKAYTRDGEFHPNSQGQLVNKQGYLVQGSSGPIQFDPTAGGAISIAPTGEISQNGNLVGSVKVVDFGDYKKLNAIGGGCFVLNDPTYLPTPPAKISVQQGFIESANTSTVAEMANLLSSVRFFEANQKVVQAQDDRMAKLIADLGNPS